MCPGPSTTPGSQDRGHRFAWGWGGEQHMGASAAPSDPPGGRGRPSDTRPAAARPPRPSTDVSVPPGRGSPSQTPNTRQLLLLVSWAEDRGSLPTPEAELWPVPRADGRSPFSGLARARGTSAAPETVPERKPRSLCGFGGGGRWGSGPGPETVGGLCFPGGEQQRPRTRRTPSWGGRAPP